MRVTPFIIFNRLTGSFQKNLKDLLDIHNKLSTGKKFDKPSDDVIGISKAMDYRLSINANEQYRKNIDEATSYLSFTEGIMESVTETLTRAKELAVRGATGTESAESRASIAKEVANLKDQLLSLANSKLRDRYVFSGFKTNTSAFNAAGTYQGDTGIMNVMIDKGATIALNVPGSTAFSYGGGTFFNVLDNLRTALENNDVAGIQASLTPLDGSIDQVLNVRADLGARLNYLDGQSNRLEDSNFALKGILSNVEDTDIAEALGELSKTEAALQSLRDSSARIISQSLLDFLR